MLRGLWGTDGDCDDADPTVHPAATDLCGDGIDQDCDEISPDCDTGDPVDTDLAPAPPPPEGGCAGWGGAYAFLPFALALPRRRRDP